MPLRLLNSDPTTLGRRSNVSAAVVSELLLSRSAGTRRIALRAMPMVAGSGDQEAIAVVVKTIERGHEVVCDVGLQVLSQLIIPGDQRALSHIACLLMNSREILRDAGKRAAFMVLQDDHEVGRLVQMAQLMRESKGATGIETPLMITARLLVELGQTMGGMAEDEQAKILRMWDGSEDWGAKVTILAALDSAKSALLANDAKILIHMTSHPQEAVRIIARELLAMVAFDGSWVRESAASVEGIVASLMEHCVGDDASRAAEGRATVSRVLSSAFARRTLELLPEIRRERQAKEERDRAEKLANEEARERPAEKKRGVYTGNKYTRK